MRFIQRNPPLLPDNIGISSKPFQRAPCFNEQILPLSLPLIYLWCCRKFFFFCSTTPTHNNKEDCYLGSKAVRFWDPCRRRHFLTVKTRFSYLVWFYRISTISDYLMLNPLYILLYSGSYHVTSGIAGV